MKTTIKPTEVTIHIPENYLNMVIMIIAPVQLLALLHALNLTFLAQWVLMKMDVHTVIIAHHHCTPLVNGEMKSNVLGHAIQTVVGHLMKSLVLFIRMMAVLSAIHAFHVMRKT